MNLVRIIDSLRDNLKVVVYLGYAVLALLVVADVVRLMGGHGEEHAAAPVAEEHAAAMAEAEHATAEHGHAATPAAEHTEAAGEHGHGFWISAYHKAEAIPGFWSIFGLLGCFVLVIVSKTYGHTPISVREDYYHG